MAAFRIDGVRLAFPDLWEPKSVKGGATKYKACFIIDPKSKAAKDIEAAVQNVAKEKWADKATKVLETLTKGDRVAYRKDERANKDGDVYDGFEGMFSLNGSNKVQPKLLDADKTPLSRDSGRPYAGCYVNAVVDIWAQDNPDPSIGRRINCTILGVQYAKAGDAFGGQRVASDDDFDAVAVDEVDL